MGRGRRGGKIKLGNNVLMLTGIFSLTIRLYQFYKLPSAFKKTKIDN